MSFVSAESWARRVKILQRTAVALFAMECKCSM